MRTSAALLLTSLLMAVTIAAAPAQEAKNKLPPENAPKVSEIIAKIESRPDFRNLESVEWQEEGYYEITYHTSDKATVEIKIDAATGQPRD